MKSTSALKEIADLSAAQWGLVTTAQAKARGVTRLDMARLADGGHLERLVHGVYRDAAVPETAFDEVRSIWLSFEPEVTAESRLQRAYDDVIVSGSTAAWLQDLGDLQPAPYEFATPRRRQSKYAKVKFKIEKIDRDELTIVHGLPTTNPTKTVGDLIRVSSDLTLVAQVVADSVSKTLDFDKLILSLNKLPKIRNVSVDAPQLVETLKKLAGVHESQIALDMHANLQAALSSIKMPEMSAEIVASIERVGELGRLLAEQNQTLWEAVALEKQRNTLARRLAARAIERATNE